MPPLPERTPESFEISDDRGGSSYQGFVNNITVNVEDEEEGNVGDFSFPLI